MNLKISFSIISLIILNLLIPLNAQEKQKSGPLDLFAAATGPVGNVMTLISFFKELISVGDNSQEKYEARLTQAFNDIHDISIKVSDMTNAIQNVGTTIVSALNQIEINKSYNDRVADMIHILNESKEIDIKFRHHLLPLLSRYKSASQQDITKFIDDTFNDNKLLRRLLLIDEWSSGLAQYKLNSDPNNVYSIAIKHYSRILKNKNFCGQSSVYNKIHDMYQYMLGCISEGYSMLFMAYEFQQQRPGNTDNRRPAQRIVLEQYKEAVIRMTTSVNSYLKKIDETEYKKLQECDDEKWTEGKNYIRLKNHVSYHEPSTRWDYDQNAEILNNMKPEHECNGTQVFWNPSAISDGVIYSLNCPLIFVSDYTEDSSCQRFPKNDFTKAKNIDWESACTTGVNSKLQQLCSCDKQIDQDTSIRTLSLREHYTDSADNRVVTGIRFIVKNNIVTIRIREGKLVNGIIDPQTLRWIDDDGQRPRMGSDTVKLGYDIRAFELDDIELPDEHLVTGVKFILTNEKRISLAVRGSAMYNDRKRTFSSIHDQWYYSKPNPYKPRTNIDIQYSKNSADLEEHNLQLSTPGLNYVDFSTSVYSLNSENVAIIPFIDSRELVTNPPIALGGLGIFYKSRPGYGGFIAFKFITAKYNIHLDSNFAQAMNNTFSDLQKYVA
ncbi:uncharacterized protein LOC103580763 [Microplitis demolitor]|uniref:uncharacterized protein LOC103580763 n=1 Tax=Microplitis demolitor TaxID=69319 RepID=UPI0006D4E028|nr:uncharacterized protein LOC103580763 [Microplitis demolitor]